MPASRGDPWQTLCAAHATVNHQQLQAAGEAGGAGAAAGAGQDRLTSCLRTPWHLRLQRPALTLPIWRRRPWRSTGRESRLGAGGRGFVTFHPLCSLQAKRPAPSCLGPVSSSVPLRFRLLAKHGAARGAWGCLLGTLLIITPWDRLSCRLWQIAEWLCGDDGEGDCMIVFDEVSKARDRHS